MIERIFIEQGLKKIELENYMKQQLEKAGFTHLDIVKTPLVTRIVLNVTRPGLAIGKGGQAIRQLTKEIEEKFGISNPQIEIKEITNPNLDAKATVDRIVALLERGFSWRSIAFKTVKDIMAAGAQGCELILSGKLTGKGGRKRKQRIAEGYMKKVGNQIKYVDYAKRSAYPKAGAIGIKLRIIRPDVKFPDKFDVKEAIAKQKEPKPEALKAKEEVSEMEEKEEIGEKEIEGKETEVKEISEKETSVEKESKETAQKDKTNEKRRIFKRKEGAGKDGRENKEKISEEKKALAKEGGVGGKSGKEKTKKDAKEKKAIVEKKKTTEGSGKTE